MKALVLLPYFERPKMVRGALESLKRDQGSDWTLHFIDDGSVERGEPIVREILGDAPECVYIPNSVQDKKLQGGSIHGVYMNERVSRGTEDVVVCLCDDDALVEGAIPALLRWYEENPEAKWSYGHVSVYDPSKEPVPWGRRSPKYHTNRFKGPLRPSCAVDSSQVTFRRKFMEPYAFPQTANLDATIFYQMYIRHGPCPFNGIVTQYKGVFSDQLGFRQGKANEFEVRVQ